MRDLYHPFLMSGNPLLVMDARSAEVTKYAANSMLALRISFMNDIATLCERCDADVDKVRIWASASIRALANASSSRAPDTAARVFPRTCKL